MCHVLSLWRNGTHRGASFGLHISMNSSYILSSFLFCFFLSFFLSFFHSFWRGIFCKEVPLEKSLLQVATMRHTRTRGTMAEVEDKVAALRPGHPGCFGELAPAPVCFGVDWNIPTSQETNGKLTCGPPPGGFLLASFSSHPKRGLLL